MRNLNRKDYLFLYKLNRQEGLTKVNDVKRPLDTSSLVALKLIENYNYYNILFKGFLSETREQKNVHYVSKHVDFLFSKYLETSESLKDLIVEIESRTGLLLFPNGRNILYKILRKTSDIIRVAAFESYDNTLFSYSIGEYHFSDGSLNDGHVFDFHYYGSEYKNNTVLDILTFLSFLKVVKHEVKTIESTNASKKRELEYGGELYRTNSKYPIQVIGTTWYTTINRVFGFNVKGHFRWQPYGIGRTLKKLIWIDSFRKHGYYREAKMLSN